MSCARGCCESQREHYLSLRLSAEATPSRRPQAIEKLNIEKRWKADHAAYRRLRKDGLHPRTSVGAAEMEKRATSAAQIEGRPE